MPTKWTHLDLALVRVESACGRVGWGEGFAYSCRRATVAAIEDMVAPLLVGREVEDIPALTLELQQRLHIQGRYGITIFAISAVDIALWDLKAKREGVPLSGLLSETRRDSVPAYASLVRYGDPERVRTFARQVRADGYRTMKLHEITLEAIAAGREGAGPEMRISTDVNCNWSAEDARTLMPEMKRLDLCWVEEPVFPPDDAAALGALQAEFGVPIASGENACTAVEFARLAPAIRYIQPSVIKVGGVSEFLKVCDLAEAHGSTIMPHTPYFGPGYWATLQLMAARVICELFEHLYIKPVAYLDPAIPLPEKGMVAIPDRPGIGFEPDMELLQRYRA